MHSTPLRTRLLAKAKTAGVVFALLAALLIPIYLTLKTVEVPTVMVPVSFNPSPLGYTWSLLLFIVPILFILVWLHQNSGKGTAKNDSKKAFYLTLGIIAPLGFLLDLFFGAIFFTFANTKAVLGIYLPGFDLYTWKWIPGALPIEEFAFYVFGIAAVLLIYIWANEAWLAAYKVGTGAFRKMETKFPTLRTLFSASHLHWESIFWGLAAIVGADIYYQLHSGYHAFPGYITFIILAAIVPSALFYPVAKPRINWQAFSFTLIFLLLVSLLWEATLAAPYQWWGYQHEQMVGIFIDAWYGLPIEATLIWLMVTFTTVIIYEVIGLWVGEQKKN